MRTILLRLIYGEPIPNKAWTVFYYDHSISSRLLKFLFGLRGCYRIDCDDLGFKTFPSGFAVMVDKENDSCGYIWIFQVEKYVCNFGYKEILKQVELHAETMMKNAMQAQFESQMQGVVMPLTENSPMSKGDMYG